jgi:hypothetical protein
MDVDSISLGRDFRSELQKKLAACDLMLVIIDKDWAGNKDEKGRRRLENPGDYVRMEIETALKRDIVVTPVLVKGALMPDAQELPAEIQDLVYRNAFELTYNRWESDMQEMIRRLGLDPPEQGGPAGLRVGGEREGRKHATAPRRAFQWPLVIAGVVGAACFVAITSWFVLPQSGSPPSTSTTNPTNAPPQASAAIKQIIKDRPQVAPPTFTLVLGGRPAGSNPSIEDVASAVKAAGARDKDPFLILRRSEQEYIQALNEPKGWRLEYRAGPLQFVCDQPPDTEQVIRTMQLYREDNAGWAQICKWRAL